MNNILTEKEYQRFIIDKLVLENGYIERKSVKFDRNFAIDREFCSSSWMTHSPMQWQISAKYIKMRRRILS